MSEDKRPELEPPIECGGVITLNELGEVDYPVPKWRMDFVLNRRKLGELWFRAPVGEGGFELAMKYKVRISFERVSNEELEGLIESDDFRFFPNLRSIEPV